MRKGFTKIFSLVLAAAMVIQPIPGATGLQTVNAAVADQFAIPGADANARVGAKVPYTRYDSKAASLGGGAYIETSSDWGRMNIATQASEQSYVKLPSSGSYAQWTVNTTGKGVTMRFTMPDSGDGMGLNGSLDVYVNGQYQKTINLTSYYMWQYFTSGTPSDTNNGGAPGFAFDEVHFTLNNSLKAGDTIRIQSTGASGLQYGVDFVEVEEVEAEISQPANSVNVRDFGAVPNDGVDDYAAINSAVSYANSNGMDVYIPAGTFHINQIWRLTASNIKITGAGMWYTNIQFTNSAASSGGISGNCYNVEFCNMYLNSNLRSRYNQQAVYKCFMDVFSGGSVIHDIWEEHFECGFWFGDYDGSTDYSDGVKVVDCRIRNNLADGVNFCQGTSNATVYNCSIRNNGDDGLAMWNNNYAGAKDESGNVFAYNTIDFIWRAGGIAIYGGSGHRVYNNYICDTYLSSGIHMNTTFDGYKFGNNSGITFDNNTLVRCGTDKDCWNEDLAAIDIKGDVRNVTFNNTQIYDAPAEGIRIFDGNQSGIVFNNTKIYGAGRSGVDITYSCVTHTATAIRQSNAYATFNGLTVANVMSDRYGNNSSWPYWGETANLGGATFNNSLGYTVPSYPTPDNTSQGGSTGGTTGGSTSGSTSTSATQIPGTISISSYSAKTDSITFTTENGVTYAGNLTNDSYLTYPVNVTESGNYKITLKLAAGDSQWNADNMLVKVDGNTAATVGITGSSSWTTFIDHTATVNFSSTGSHTITIQTVGGACNVTDIVVEKVSSGSNSGSDSDSGSGSSGTGQTATSGNLAKGKTVTASSNENADYVAANAVDENTGTRWASEWSDNQWITVDLGATYAVNKVVLNWEAAYGQAYKIQTSTDGVNYTTVKELSNQDGGIDTIEFTATNARYVRMQGVTRALPYGYSLWEMEVYASASGSSGESNSGSSTAYGEIQAASANASGAESDAMGAQYAIDGDTGTRWSSNFADDAWLTIDLGKTYSVDKVVLNWEAAYGESYNIQVSTDGYNFTTVKALTGQDGGEDTITFDAVNARYVRVQGVKRALPYGYSLWECQVYGQ